MSHLAITRREFSRGLMVAGGMMMFSRRTPAATFTLRQFHNQPTDSPLPAQAPGRNVDCGEDRNGRESPGPDLPGEQSFQRRRPRSARHACPRRTGLLHIEWRRNRGPLTPANVQAVPFAFRTLTQVYSALDGDLGDYLREEIKAKGIYAVPRACFENGFHQITCSTRPIRTAGMICKA